jgi:hypothetical protein
MMAYLTVLGTMPAYANSSLLTHCNPDQAFGRDFQENVSFDHYFATYPNAANPMRPSSSPAGHPGFS